MITGFVRQNGFFFFRLPPIETSPADLDAFSMEVSRKVNDWIMSLKKIYPTVSTGDIILTFNSQYLVVAVPYTIAIIG